MTTSDERPGCPRCREETDLSDPTIRRYRGGVGIGETAPSLHHPNHFERDSDGHDWWMCPRCGLLWCEQTGQRNRGASIYEDPVMPRRTKGGVWR